jgi:type IV secretion system protein VirD4
MKGWWPPPRLKAPASTRIEGGLQQQRHPGLGAEQVVQTHDADRDVLTGIEEESDEVSDRSAMDRLRLAPVQRTYGINEGEDRGDDLLPSF